MTRPNFAREQLKSVADRITRLEEEKAALAAGIKEVFVEAKGNGFDVKILRQVLRRRKMSPAERSTLDEMIDLYESAIEGNG